MTLKYQHTQRGGLSFYLVLIVFTGLYAVLIIEAVNGRLQHDDKIALAICPLLGGYIILMLSGLTVTINDERIRIQFGPGVFWKTYPVNKIADCRPVRNCWWWGWGIRWYIRGWLYNISGLDGVEITFKNGKKVRIGTDQPQSLADAINKAIQHT
ncbi:MAG: hypothetical protein KBI46_02015 [Phycisphaerae bacterium]|nr:hypothetical protein [Phycisphaerae bacterium]